MRRIQPVSLMPWPPPRPLSSFVGRSDELAELVAVLSTRRLVTLIGPGGGGKTRLAIEVASRLAPAFGQGVAFVDLAPIGDPALVAEVAVSALGASPRASSAIASVIGEAELLLVIDNAEHLVDAVAGLVAELLASCPRLKVLVTSREVLGVAGEVSWGVPRLKLPSAGQTLGPSELLKFDAIRLFCARAAEQRRDFELTVENADLVASICRRLNGIPLALELGAARVRSMALSDIASRLLDSFRLLTGGPRTAVDRHRTLGATIDWSHRLLNEAERRLFRRLSVFVGTFDLAAVEAICSGRDLPSEGVADIIQRLVDKSLVVAHARPDGHLRYSLIEAIRQYGQERLREAGESRFRAGHAAHYANLVFRLADDRKDLGASVQRMAHEYDNVRVALDWAADQDASMEGRLVASLRWFWLTRGSVREASEAAVSALTRAHPDAALRVALLIEAASWLQQTGDFEGGIQHIENAVGLLDQVQDPVLVSHVHRTRGVIFALMQDPARAEPDLIEAAESLKGLPFSQDMAEAQNNLAMVHLQQGRLGDALHDVTQMGLTSFDRLSTQPQWAHTQGAVFLALGRSREAAECFLEGVAIAAHYDNHAASVELLEGLACSAAMEGDPVLCLELLAAAERSGRLAGVDRPNIGTPTDAVERASRAVLSPRAAAAALARGSRLDLKAAIQRAETLGRAQARGPLTARKREIVRFVAQGMTSREIARRLSISERTVDAHLEQTRNELGLHSRAQIAAWAMAEGLLSSVAVRHDPQQSAGVRSQAG